jgi:branched-chain amino acid aminotransferase
MSLPWTADELGSRLRRLLDANRIDQGRIRITVTRGEGDLRARPEEMGPPSLIMTADPLEPPTPGAYERGVPVEIANRIRNLPGALDPAIKSGNLLNNLLARFEVKNPDTFEVLLPNHRGELSEGSLSNLFIVDEEGRLRTPGEESGILVGITRALVIELARAEGLDCREGSLGRDELLASREAFLTASTLELLPISHVDGQVIGAGGAGPVARLLLDRYQDRVREDCAGSHQ